MFNLRCERGIRHHVSIHVLNWQLYYALIYPYLNYAVAVWGNTYQSNLNKLCSLQNKCIRCMFFAGSRESSQVLYKLLDILEFDNIVKLRTCVLAHKIFNKSSYIPSLFHDSLTIVSSLHKYNTRYACRLHGEGSSPGRNSAQAENPSSVSANRARIFSPAKWARKSENLM